MTPGISHVIFLDVSYFLPLPTRKNLIEPLALAKKAGIPFDLAKSFLAGDGMESSILGKYQTDCWQIDRAARAICPKWDAVIVPSRRWLRAWCERYNQAASNLALLLSRTERNVRHWLEDGQPRDLLPVSGDDLQKMNAIGQLVTVRIVNGNIG